VLVTERPLDDLHCRVPRQTLGEQRGSLDRCGYERVTPPLMRHFVRHHGKRKIDVPRIAVGVQQREPLLVRDVDRSSVEENRAGGCSTILTWSCGYGPNC